MQYIVVVCILLFSMLYFVIRKLSNDIVDPIERLSGISKIYDSSSSARLKDIKRDIDTALSFKTFGETYNLTESIKVMADALYAKIISAREESNAKSTFLANMSHEIRTPMNAVIGMTKIALNADSTEEKNKCLGKIEVASVHLLHLINDILDMAKIESNKIELEHSDFIFSEIVNSITNIFNFSSNAKNIELDISVDEKIPKVLNGDQFRINQITSNLISNAIKFSPENSKIHVSFDLMDSDAEKCIILISVRDHGIGISEAAQKKLFQPFQQADADTTRKYGGTGLGLTICKRLVALMKGEIWLESIPGKGTTFSFTVVLDRADENLAAAQSDVATCIQADLSSRTILIAEDVEINREILQSVLEESSIQIDYAVNGKEAVEMFEKNPDRYDLILMDIQMPEMNGFEATRRIREIGTQKATTIPIIALSANVFQEDIKKCREAGMSDHLGKPIEFDKLFEKLNKYLAK